MTEVTPFPWARVMQFAFGQLRLSPEAFWSMTMYELNHAMGPYRGCLMPAMSRHELDRLISEHPDERGQNADKD